MGTVSTTAELWSHVSLDVRDNQVIDIQTLDLGVRLSVLEEIQDEAA